jgi:hypothetical protein
MIDVTFSNGVISNAQIDKETKMSIKKIPFLYIYDIDEKVLTKSRDLTFERQTFHQGTTIEEDHFFANDFKNRKRIEISEFPDKVLYKLEKGVYVIWSNTDDEKRALYLIGLKIISELDDFIKRTNVQIDKISAIVDGLNELVGTEVE